MTPEEVEVLVDMAMSYRNPDTFGPTPYAAWHVVLDDVDAADGVKAFHAVAKETSWIKPQQIREKALELRAARFAAGLPTPPAADPDRPVEYNARLREMLDQVGSGNGQFAHLALDPPEVSAARPSDSYRQARAEVEGVSAAFAESRRMANTVPCPFCKAAVGVTCMLPDGAALAKSAAHTERLEDVGLAEPVQRYSVDEYAVMLGLVKGGGV